MKTALTFDNQFTSTLPSDSSDENVRRQLKDALYARVSPTPVAAPYLVAHASEVANLIGLTDEDIATSEFLQVFSGNQQLVGMDPHATCYGGHQFGNWAGQLGDGRAINLGEVVTDTGHWMLQLKATSRL